MKWWLFVLAFVLGALVTWIYMVRRATREVRIVEVDSPEALGAADDYDDDGAYEAGYDEEYDDDDQAYGDSPAADVAVTERRAALVDEPMTVRHAPRWRPPPPRELRGQAWPAPRHTTWARVPRRRSTSTFRQ